MESQRRGPDDVALPDGTFGRALDRMRRWHEAHDLRIGMVYAFDFRTRVLPGWHVDKRMAPCSVRTLLAERYERGSVMITIDRAGGVGLSRFNCCLCAHLDPTQLRGNLP